MKNYNLKLVFIIYIFTLSNVFADNCSDPALNCFNFSHPFKYCYVESGVHSIITYCARDPYNPVKTSDFQGDFTILKFMNMPVCVEFVNSGPDVVLSNICNNGVCKNGVIYHKTVVNNDIKYSNNLWRCLCYQSTNESSLCNCTIKIKFVDKNINEFNNPKLDVSSNTSDFIKDSEITNNDCKISCDNLNIYLNNTEDFTLRSSQDHYYQFYSTSDIIYTDGFHPSGSRSIIGTITRESGKIFGFGSNQRPENGQCQYPPIKNERIMYEGENWDFNHLSDLDKCMFKKLYCPTTLGVIEDNNIKDEYKDLQLFLNYELQFDKIIIYDLLGNKTIYQDLENFNYNDINKSYDINRFSIVCIFKDNLLINTIKVLK